MRILKRVISYVIILMLVSAPAWATISTQPTRNEYTSTSGQTVFTYTFKIFSDTDLNVYVTPSGQESDDSTDIVTNYSVTGVGDENGGSITFTSGVTAGDLVTIVSGIPSNRTTDYQFNGDFLPGVVNDDFDRVVSLAKQTEDITNRSLVTAQSQQGVKPLTLPTPLAGRFLKWKSDLSGVENADAGTTTPINLPVDTLSNHDDLADAVSDIGATDTELWLDQSDSSNATVPANIVVRPMFGSSMSGTVTWNGAVTGDPTFQWLTGAGHTFAGPVKATWFSSFDLACDSGSLDIELYANTTYSISATCTPATRADVYGPASAIVTTSSAIIIFDINNDNNTLRGFSIDGNGVAAKCIDIDGASGSEILGTRLLNLTIVDAAGSNVPNVYTDYADDILIQGCKISGAEQKGGIRAERGENIRILGNHIHDNGSAAETADGPGIVFEGVTNSIIDGNIIQDNYWMGIIMEDEGVDESDNVVISNNFLKNNQGAGATVPTTEIHIESDGNFIIEGNIIYAVDATAAGAVHRGILVIHPVDSGDIDDYRTIVSNNIIWGNLANCIGIIIEAGAIVEGNQIHNTYKAISNVAHKDDITINGNIIKNTTLQAIEIDSGSAQTNSRLIISNNNIMNAGQADDAADYTNAAIGARSNNTLSNCVMSNNTITDDQGTATTYNGIRLEGIVSQTVIEGNTISDMEAEGIYIASARQMAVANNIIDDGTVGIYMGAGARSEEANITGNTLNSQSSHAIQITDSVYSNISGNTIVAAGGDGIRFDESAADMIRNTISSNRIKSATGPGISVIIVNAGNDFNANVINGNMSTGSSLGLAIDTDGRADNNIITSNYLAGNTGTSDIDAGDWGASAVIANNINP